MREKGLRERSVNGLRWEELVTGSEAKTGAEISLEAMQVFFWTDAVVVCAWSWPRTHHSDRPSVFDRLIAQIRHSPPNLISRVYGVFNSVDEPLSVESFFNMNSTSASCFLMYS
jgi:hypothetical protein